ALTASTRTIRINHTSGTTMAAVTSSVVSSDARPLRPRTARTRRCCSGQLTYARMPPQISGTMNGRSTLNVSSTIPRISAATRMRRNQGAVGRSASMLCASVALGPAGVELGHECVEPSLFERRTHGLHQGQILVEIMNGAEARGQNLAALVEVSQISAAVVAACVTRTGRVERRGIGLIARVADLQHAGRREQMTVARMPRRHDAVEHVHAAANRLDQVLGRADAHQ